MKKSSTFLFSILLLCGITLFAQSADEANTGGGIDWFQVIITGGYLVGVFILLPIVIYTNMKEKIFDPAAEGEAELPPLNGLNDDERNARAQEILDQIAAKMTPFTSDDGEELITITKGSQAKFTKRGLDYILKYLKPTDADIMDRVYELKGVYDDRARRAFTGSKWVIACSAGIGLLLWYSVGFSTFLVIHFLGLAFYILSSRTTFYGIEKRIKYFGGGAGLISGIMGGLFLGDGVKYYVKEGSGPWQRDWETEGNMAIIGLFFLFVAAMFLGFFAVVLGVVNFLINYSTNFIIPFKSDERWYEEKFVSVPKPLREHEGTLV